MNIVSLFFPWLSDKFYLIPFDKKKMYVFCNFSYVVLKLKLLEFNRVKMWFKQDSKSYISLTVYGKRKGIIIPGFDQKKKRYKFWALGCSPGLSPDTLQHSFLFIPSSSEFFSNNTFILLFVMFTSLRRTHAHVDHQLRMGKSEWDNCF